MLFLFRDTGEILLEKGDDVSMLSLPEKERCHRVEVVQELFARSTPQLAAFSPVVSRED